MWEYTRRVAGPADNYQKIDSILNELGSKGWECYHVNRYAAGAECSIGYTFWFKRPQPQDPAVKKMLAEPKLKVIPDADPSPNLGGDAFDK